MIQADTLKPGWKLVKFGDVVRQVKDKVDPKTSGLERYVAGEHMDTDDLRIRRWGEINDNYLGPAFHMRFKPSQVLYGSRRTYLRKVSVPDFEGICANTTFVLESKDPNVLLPELLPFIMQTEAFHEHSIKQSKGSVNPYVNFSDLAWWEFPIPPIEEQKRITESLSAIVQSIYKYEQLLKACQLIVQSYIESVFDWQQVKSLLKNKNTIKNLGFIELGNVCSLQVGYPFKSSGYTSTGDRLLRCSNVGIDTLDWQPDKTCFWPSEHRKEFSEYMLSTGDIVVAMDRPFVGAGFKVAKVSDTDLPALLLQRVGRFIPSENIEREFLWCFLHSMSIQFQLKGQQQGTDLPHISKFDIEGTILPKIPIDQQKSIGAKYQELSLVVQKVKIRLSFLRNFKSQLMKKVLFS
ncbi:restriction endonuclease subunit S [Anabaena azotica]|uniref:Restriction endonuclease subunit S n=1 Tax=Anabaena azotica FACHB-119 TaxID=947527 RepID=A0ABR8DC22_9NOST|nr:restriction endonuclease subunit S [Anabaena azotica]MBD2504043.1 restriction endonuclease subunit S [Anabaena azotica FACHB-119]